jgi:hypothetical protein
VYSKVPEGIGLKDIVHGLMFGFRVSICETFCYTLYIESSESASLIRLLTHRAGQWLGLIREEEASFVRLALAQSRSVTQTHFDCTRLYPELDLKLQSSETFRDRRYEVSFGMVQDSEL